MTKGELIQRLIEDYSYYIKYIEENLQESSVRDVKHYLTTHHIGYGICYYTSYLTNNNRISYNAEWVGKYNDPFTVKWGTYPIDCPSRLTLLYSLCVRLTNLKKELASGDNLDQKLTSKYYKI